MDVGHLAYLKKEKRKKVSDLCRCSHCQVMAAFFAVSQLVGRAERPSIFTSHVNMTLEVRAILNVPL